MSDNIVIDLRRYEEDSYGRKEIINYLSPKALFKEILIKIGENPNFRGIVLVGRSRKNNLEGFSIDLFNKGWLVMEEDNQQNNYQFSILGEVTLNVTSRSVNCVSNPEYNIKNKEIVEIQIYNEPKPSKYGDNDVYYPYSCLYPPSKNISKQIQYLSQNDRKIEKRFNI